MFTIAPLPAIAGIKYLDSRSTESMLIRRARSPSTQVDIHHHASDGAGDTHVVYQDVHPAMLLEYVRGEAAANRVISNVCDDRRDVHTERGTHLDGAFEIRPDVVDQNDMGAGLGETDSAGTADADPGPPRSGTADDCNFARQTVIEHVWFRFAGALSLQ